MLSTTRALWSVVMATRELQQTPIQVGSQPEGAARGRPPPPPAPVPSLPASSVTVVRTAAELQAAFSAPAQDIEIQSHLDLRDLDRPVNTAFSRAVSDSSNRLALAYAQPPTRSMRGNCSDPDAAAALGLAAEDAATMRALPLKSRQCLLLLQDPLLMVNDGPFWLDNVYLLLSQLRERVIPSLQFVRTGHVIFDADEQNDTTGNQLSGPQVYVTNVTMHGALRGSSRGIDLEAESSAVLLQDCILTDLASAEPVLGVHKRSVASVVDTVIRNTHLSAEIADVSYGGAVHFSNVSLANVVLEHGTVVDTTQNDYILQPVANFKYYPGDDEEYDVDVSPVSVGDRGMFGEDFVLGVPEQNMSDCVFTEVPLDAIMPGCPPVSVRKRREMLERGWQSSDAIAYIEEYDAREGGDLVAEFESKLLLPASPWLVALRAVLGPLPPAPPGWPPFLVPPPAEPQNRTDLSMSTQGPPARPPWPPFELLSPAEAWNWTERGTRMPGGDRSNTRSTAGQQVVGLAVVAAVVLSVAVAASVWAAAVVRRMARRAGSQLRASRRYGALWMSAGLDLMTTSHASGAHGSQLEPDNSLRDGVHVSADQRILLNPMPASAMNAAYEYVLPRHLALFGPRSLGSDEACAALAPSMRPLQGGAGSFTTGIKLRGLDRQRTAAGSMPSKARAGRGLALPVDSSSSGAESTAGGGSGRTVPLTRRAAAERSVESLEACSVEPGSTVVVSPFDDTTATSSSVSRTGGTRSAGITTGSRLWAESKKVPSTTASTKTSEGAAASMLGAPLVAGGLLGTALAAMEAQPAPAPEIQPVATPDIQLAATSATAGRTRPPPRNARAAHPQHTTAGEWHAERVARRASRLQRQLDAFGEDDLFLGRYEMLGRQHRQRGGQGMVQFAVAPDGCDFAIKFFLDLEAFLTEATLYAACFPHVRSGILPEAAERAAAFQRSPNEGGATLAEVASRFLPHVEAVCDGSAGGLEDPRGRRLPPCIVMEKGESLHDWSERAEPDIFTSLAVLSNISKRLADMHDAGYVHRDLKPANIMWLPRQNRWTVIDFGNIARAGEAAPLSFTLTYAPPEVADAYSAGARRIRCTAALDTWSLGVVAFELLTAAPAFNMLSDGRAKVVQRLQGDLPLPWEGALTADIQARLGVFKKPVLQLLQRDPAQRSTMRQFHDTCAALSAGSGADIEG